MWFGLFNCADVFSAKPMAGRNKMNFVGIKWAEFKFLTGRSFYKKDVSVNSIFNFKEDMLN